MTGADIVTAARALVGTRYRHQGRSLEGVDCIGLPVLVRARVGLPALDAEPGYPRVASDTTMLDFCRAHMHEVQREAIAPGDLLVQVDGLIRHMAIVSDYPGGGLAIIHAWLPFRRVVENRLDEDFMRSVRGCFRFREVTP